MFGGRNDFFEVLRLGFMGGGVSGGGRQMKVDTELVMEGEIVFILEIEFCISFWREEYLGWDFIVQVLRLVGVDVEVWVYQFSQLFQNRQLFKVGITWSQWREGKMQGCQNQDI